MLILSLVINFLLSTCLYAAAASSSDFPHVFLSAEEIDAIADSYFFEPSAKRIARDILSRPKKRDRDNSVASPLDEHSKRVAYSLYQQASVRGDVRLAALLIESLPELDRPISARSVDSDLHLNMRRFVKRHREEVAPGDDNHTTEDIDDYVGIRFPKRVMNFFKEEILGASIERLGEIIDVFESYATQEEQLVFRDSITIRLTEFLYAALDAKDYDTAILLLDSYYLYYKTIDFDAKHNLFLIAIVDSIALFKKIVDLDLDDPGFINKFSANPFHNRVSPEFSVDAMKLLIDAYGVKELTRPLIIKKATHFPPSRFSVEPSPQTRLIYPFMIALAYGDAPLLKFLLSVKNPETGLYVHYDELLLDKIPLMWHADDAEIILDCSLPRPHGCDPEIILHGTTIFHWLACSQIAPEVFIKFLTGLSRSDLPSGPVDPIASEKIMECLDLLLKHLRSPRRIIYNTALIEPLEFALASKNYAVAKMLISAGMVSEINRASFAMSLFKEGQVELAQLLIPSITAESIERYEAMEAASYAACRSAVPVAKASGAEYEPLPRSHSLRKPKVTRRGRLPTGGKELTKKIIPLR